MRNILDIYFKYGLLKEKIYREEKNLLCMSAKITQSVNYCFIFITAFNIFNNLWDSFFFHIHDEILLFKSIGLLLFNLSHPVFTFRCLP